MAGSKGREGKEGREGWEGMRQMRNEITRRNGLCTHVSAVLVSKFDGSSLYLQETAVHASFAGTFGWLKREEGGEGGEGRNER